MGKIIKLKNDIYIANEYYSTNETIVGKYLNKPLYRKIFSLYTLTTDQEFGSLYNVERIVRLDGSYFKGPDGNAFGINTFINNDFYLNTWVWVDINSVCHLYNRAKGYIGYDGHIIVEYTKTTD